MAPCSPERSAQRAPATKPLPALQRRPPPRPRPPPHSPPAACPQPRPHAQSPQPVPPQDGAAELPRSRQAQCESRAASPAHPRARESPTPRPNASAQYPRCGTSGFPQDQTGRQQTAPPSAPHDPDSPAQAPPQICTAPPLPPPVQAANCRPIYNPGNWTADDRSKSWVRHRLTECAKSHLQRLQTNHTNLQIGNRDMRPKGVEANRYSKLLRLESRSRGSLSAAAHLAHSRAWLPKRAP